MVRFSEQTAVVRDHAVPGRYRAEVSGDWNAPILPQGGVVAALGLRAMGEELGVPDQRLRSVSIVFAGKVPPGPVAIDVNVLRRGRSVSQLAATVRPTGAGAGLTVLAVFGSSRPGFAFTDLTAPQGDPLEIAPSIADRPESYRTWTKTVWDHVEYRLAKGHFPWSAPWQPGFSERIAWLRFHDTPRLEDGTVDPLALVSLCDFMPGAIVERMGPDCPFFLAPSMDLAVHLLTRSSSDWFLGRNRCRFAGEGYASLEMELWDPTGGLVAYATQVALLTFPETPDSVAPPRRSALAQFRP